MESSLEAFSKLFVGTPADFKTLIASFWTLPVGMAILIIDISSKKVVQKGLVS